MERVHVAIGIIVRGGEVLLSRRRAGDRFEACWEFPGGKLEARESAESCLHREMAEELGVSVAIRGRLAAIVHDYEDLSVCLHPFIVVLESGEPAALASRELRWIRPEDLHAYPLPAANEALAGQLPLIVRTLRL